MTRTQLILASFVCGIASLFYMYEFSLQVAPSVMTSELIKDFSLNAISVGFISSIFYFSYTPVQILGGISYDTFGPRIVMSTAIFICALGALCFGMAHSYNMLLVGRLLMGVGAACSFTGALLLISRWFPKNYFAPVSALLQMMCSIGAILGQIPLAYLIAHYGWQQSILGFASIGFVLAVLLVLVIRNYPRWNSAPPQTEKKRPLQGLKEVLSNQQSWMLFLYGFFSWAPMVIFAALWGIPYLCEAFDVTTAQASTALANMWIGLAVASPIIGYVSEKIGHRTSLLIFVKAVGLVATLILLFYPQVTFQESYILLFLMGVSCSGQALGFSIVNEINRPQNAGTAMGFTNTALVIGGVLMQPLASYLIKFFWDGQVINQLPYYSISAYHHAMLLLPLTNLAGIIISGFFIKETHCKPNYQGACCS